MGSSLELLGGLGLFLIGMAVMTEGLKSLTGETLRNWLSRFTNSPTTGAATGAIATAILQSSSATTVMAVGFAGAGLLTFSQSLGIIFGANIGTTLTGWLVALLGFKLQISKIVMPLIFFGALMRLFGGKRASATGYALAGFGLIFVGISVLQSAMQGFGDVLTPDSFPPDTWVGRALLVLIGIGITLVTQSSSAGVATAVTAVHVGTITLPQAAAMVIGMNVGTTFTAAAAAIGGSVNARRTGIAHVIFNILTGVLAFAILPMFVDAWISWSPASARHHPEIALVSFHTLFNAIGVLLVLPLTAPFAQLIVRLVPARGRELTRRLDRSLLKEPAIAMDVAQATLRSVSSLAFQSLSSRLIHGVDSQFDDQMSKIEDAIEETRSYVSQVATATDDAEADARHLSVLHVIDHLARLTRRCRIEERWRGIRANSELRSMADRLGRTLEIIADAIAKDGPTRHQELAPLYAALDTRNEPFRQQVIRQSARGETTTNQTLASLDAIRWLRRVCYHTWRIAIHLDPSFLPEDQNVSPERMIEGDPVDLELARNQVIQSAHTSA